MRERLTPWFLRAALALALLAFAGDFGAWSLCGSDVCTAALWERYRWIFGVVPVSGLAVVALYAVHSLLALHRGDPQVYAGYGKAGAWLLAGSAGVALYHVYLQAVVLGEACGLCLGLAGCIVGAWAMRREALSVLPVAFLAMNFLHHHGAAPGRARWEPGPMVMTAEAEESEVEGRIERSRTLGLADAPAVLEVFSDPTCPHCARFEREGLPDLVRRYVEPGRLRVILRTFTPPGREEGRRSAPFLHAAALAGRTTEVRSRLFDTLGAWEPEGLGETLQRHRGAILQVLAQDEARARELGLTATPSFSLSAGEHRNVFVGAPRPAVFQAAVERALSLGPAAMASPQSQAHQGR
ncbi:MAG: thioredoxin domain-containing protein [Planctomycetes bacterium]|nr:thioredoxin domain-containing protein [Planctomycetota bacterium]